MPKPFWKLAEILELQVLEIGRLSKEEAADCLIPYMMNDAVENYLILKDCKMTGEYVKEKEVILSEKIPMHGKANSIAVNIPPMSVMYLKPSKIQPESEEDTVIDLEAAQPMPEKPKRTRKKAVEKSLENEKKSTAETLAEKPKRTRKKTAAAAEENKPSEEETAEKPKRTRKKAQPQA